MKFVVWGLVLLLVILHQDFWFWEDATLVFGFLPVVLAWHMGISLVAAFSWFLATLFCWPEELQSEPAEGVAEEAQ